MARGQLSAALPRAYVCNGCGDVGSIVEISLVPRIFSVYPDNEGIPKPDEGMATDEVFWESEVVIGYGCTTFECEFWQGNYTSVAPSIQEVAHSQDQSG